MVKPYEEEIDDTYYQEDVYSSDDNIEENEDEYNDEKYQEQVVNAIYSQIINYVKDGGYPMCEYLKLEDINNLLVSIMETE